MQFNRDIVDQNKRVHHRQKYAIHAQTKQIKTKVDTKDNEMDLQKSTKHKQIRSPKAKP